MLEHTISAVLEAARCLKIEVQRETRKMDSIAEKTKERWHGNRMHGQLPRNLDENLVDIEQSYRWIKSGDIKRETGSKIVAAQDQEISTNYFKNKILKEETESKYRLCKQHEETVENLTSGCPIIQIIIIIIIITNARTRDRGTINNKDRIAATMYPLETWFVSGIYV